MRRTRWAEWFARFTTTAAVSAVGLSLLAAPASAIAQTAARPVANSSSGFGRTVQHLMEQAQREAAAGNLDAAIHTALRAKKIAEAASTTLGASPDCSPEAADALYRELLAQRPAAPPARTVAKATASTPKAPARKLPLTRTPVRAPATANTEQWRPQTSRPQTTAVSEPDVSRSESPAAKPVRLKRAAITAAPMATDLGLRTSMDIVGGDGTPNDSAPRRAIPPEAPAVVAITTDAPAWTPTTAPASPAPVETPAVISQPVTAAPTAAPQLRRMEASEWSSVGAVVPRQRIARAETLRTDGWQSPSYPTPAVTRAGGVTDRAEPSADAVSPTAYLRKPETVPLTEVTGPMVDAAAATVPAPPMELDAIDVALRSPSVWVRDSTPQVAPALPAAQEPATTWQSFSKWSKQRGWTATSAALVFAAAVLAVLACTVALIPRRNEQV